MNPLRKALILLPLLLALVACNINVPLLQSLAVDFSQIESVVLTDGEGESVTVTDPADFAPLQSYKSKGILPEDREGELFNSDNYCLCSFSTSGGEYAVYLFYTGEIVCFLGEDVDTKNYLYGTDGQPFDREYIETLFHKYA